MRRPRWRAAALAGSALLLAASVVSPATAGGPGRWTSLGKNSANFTVPGLERNADGSLTVVWPRPNGTSDNDDIVSTIISRTGEAGTPTPVVTNWPFVWPVIAAVSDGGSVRAFWGGNDPTLADGLWTSQGTGSPPTSWSAPTEVYGRGDAPGVTRGLDGTLYQAMYIAGEGLRVHVGLNPGTPLSQEYHYAQFAQEGDPYSVNMATDQATGDIWVVWYSSANHPTDANACQCGVYAQKADPATGNPSGPLLRMPGSSSIWEGTEYSSMIGNQIQVTSRPASEGGGVYVTYLGGYPSYQRVLLWEVGASTSRTIASVGAQSGNVLRSSTVAADPTGRIWVVWLQDDKIKAALSDANVVNFAPAITIADPGDPSVSSSYNIFSDAQSDRVDVLVNYATGNGTAFWHTQIKEVPEWTAGSDTISGTASKDVLYGGGGADTLKAAGGNDAVYGGDGNDNLDGGAGKDLMDGGKGKDTCIKTKGDRFKNCEVIKTRRSR